MGSVTGLQAGQCRGEWLCRQRLPSGLAGRTGGDHGTGAHTGTGSGGCVQDGRGARKAQAAVALRTTQPALGLPRAHRSLPRPAGTCSERWAGAGARLRARCAGRAPLRDGRASAVTQMCRWQPGLAETAALICRQGSASGAAQRGFQSVGGGFSRK